MDDMTAFERLVAGRTQHHAGPIRPVNDAAILTAITATQSPKWTFQSMFSAAKFVVAGALVALFGGFLLSGVLTQPSEESVPAAVSASPAATPDLLPGVDLVTEEVEPGVFRVLSDGTDTAMDWTFETGDPATTKVVAGQDGSVRVFNQGLLTRLGRPDFVNAGGLHEYWPDISVAPDGVVWAVSRPATDGQSGPAGNQLWSLADGRWTQHSVPEGSLLTDIETPADGSVWAGFTTGVERCGSSSVARLVDGVWQPEVIEPEVRRRRSLAVGPNGTVLVPSCGAGQLLERGDDGWAPSAAFDDSRAADFEWIGPIAMGRDGTAWVNMWGPGGSRLARRTEGDWEILGDDGSVPMLDAPQVWELHMTVSDDGRLWVAFDYPPDALSENSGYNNKSGNNYMATLGSGCPGAISFDGTTWSQHLAGACVTHVSAAPNGNVWATVVEADWWYESDPDLALDPARAPTGLYVITPEAVAATE